MDDWIPISDDQQTLVLNHVEKSIQWEDFSQVLNAYRS